MEQQLRVITTEDFISQVVPSGPEAMATIGYLLRSAQLPLCPKNPSKRVMTDIHGGSWGALIRRSAMLIDSEHAFVKKDEHTNDTLFSRKFFESIYKPILHEWLSTVYRNRMAISSQDIPDEVLRGILVEAGYTLYIPV